MKILVTGANGQLGRAIMDRMSARHEVIGLGRVDLDITVMEQVREAIRLHQPDVVLHAAAYTAVDQAEEDADAAYRVNAFGTRNVAVAAEEAGAKLCFISTDYVFDGEASVPYAEYDNTNPLSVYGKSKRAGEQMVQSLSSRWFIVRTSWLYGLEGNNFVKTMLKLAGERDRLRVVDDQIGSPTNAADLAAFLEQLVSTECYGIYHAANTGICSWYEFACAIFLESGLDVRVEPCMTEEFPRPAARPKYSVLDHLSIRANGLEDLPPWRDGLRDFLQSYRKVEKQTDGQ